VAQHSPKTLEGNFPLFAAHYTPPALERNAQRIMAQHTPAALERNAQRIIERFPEEVNDLDEDTRAAILDAAQGNINENTQQAIDRFWEILEVMDNNRLLIGSGR
jgi:hypothetical protein